MKKVAPTSKKKRGSFWHLLLDNWFQKEVPVDESVPLKSILGKKIAEFRSGIDSNSKKLGERRDAFLLGAGALYLLGYLTWALYGLINGIGFIAVLDVQYFAAGIVPVILVFLLLIIMRMLAVIQVWLMYAPTETQFTVARVTATVGYIVLVSVPVSFAVRSLRWRMLGLIAIGFLYLSQFLARNRGKRLLQGLVIWSARSYAILLLLLWAWYVERLMPLVPTEWGGAKPRCILLDVDNEQLSPESRAWIIGRDPGGGKGTVRTRALNLIFDGSEYFFLVDQGGKPSETNPVYRLRKDAVKGIFPCLPTAPATSKSSP